MSKRHLGWAGCTAAFVLALAACETRVEEPSPRRAGATASPSGTEAGASGPGWTGGPIAPVAAPGPGALASSAGPRCIKPTPAEPVRTPRVGPDPGCPDDPLETPPSLRVQRVRFDSTSAPELTVEIADTPEDRQRGLMFRRELAEDRGMLFVFEAPRDNRFWMRNTCISLDMLFIDEDGTIVGIEEATPTLSDQSFFVGCKSKYVLEVGGGFTRKHGITAGQRVALGSG